jgi:TolB-like protein
VAVDDSVLAALTGAILDGKPIDWPAVDSTAGLDPGFVRRLKEIAALADVHRGEMSDRWGPLRLLERIGQGAFGDVYRAWDSRLDREVALKLLPPVPPSGDDVAGSIIEEGRLLARIHHPNVVTIYGAERIDDRVGLWMEYISGRTLQQLVVEEGKRFSPQEVVTLGRVLCGAVEAVHGAGLLHRDIKAQNVMVSSEGRVALMDFGAGGDRSEAAAAGIVGTPLYLAPEVLSGASGPTVQSDIYSTGVLLYFLLTGTYPVSARDVGNLGAAHERGERRALKAAGPGLPRRLCQVIERAIDPDPARRYRNAGALASALERVESWKTWKVMSSAAAVAAVVFAAWFAWSPDAGAARNQDRPQIAVLPFTHSGADPDNAYFADGLTLEIIRSLQMLKGLDVRSRPSALASGETRRNLVEFGQQMRAGYVLDGSVERAGGRIRVTSQLVIVEGERTVWSESFERELTVAGILSIQDDISRAIVGRLRLTLDPPQRRYATNLANYEDYLRARALAERQGVTDPLNAARLFEKIIASDPGYAPAHAGLVLAYAYLSHAPYQGVAFDKAHAVMRAAAIEAVRLDPMLAEAQAARGWVHAREFEWADAERAFRRAIELNPGLIFSYTSFSFSTLQPLGRFADAERVLREAERIDPFATEVQLALARVLHAASRPSEAIAVLQRLRVVDSVMPMVDLQMGRALALDGRFEESLPLLERQRERLIDPAGGLHPWVAGAYVRLGRRADAERLAQKDDRLPFRRAIINAALGNTDRMFDGLEEMLDREPQRLGLLLQSPELTAYRGHERFKQLLRSLKLPVTG